jgi:basic membrane protein A
MKKRIALLLAVSFVFFSFFTACGGNGAATAGPDTAPDPDDTEINMAAAFVTVQPLGDPTIDLCYAGFTRAVEDFGFTRATVVEARAGEYEENFRALAEAGYGLIIANMPELQEAVGRVAPYYPDTMFMIALGEAPGDNVISTWNIEQYGTFVVGVFAGMMTQTNRVGFLGGVDNDQLGRVGGGFVHGVQHINPDAEVEVLFVGSFSDPTRGKDLAEVLYNSGVDIIFHASAQSGLGLFEAASERGEGHYIIGIDMDQNDVLPGQVLGSYVTPFDMWIYNAMAEYARGEFHGRVIFHCIEDGTQLKPAVDFVDIPQEVLDVVEKYTQIMMNREMEVSSSIR